MDIRIIAETYPLREDILSKYKDYVGKKISDENIERNKLLFLIQLKYRSRFTLIISYTNQIN